MKIILTNSMIYTLAQSYIEYFKTNNDIYFSAKVNYCLNKNFNKIVDIAKDIDKEREFVAAHYGRIQDDGSYFIASDNISQAQKELNDLAMMEQELDILPIKIEDLGNIQLTPAQFEAMEFMINTNEIEES